MLEKTEEYIKNELKKAYHKKDIVKCFLFEDILIEIGDARAGVEWLERENEELKDDGY